MRYRSLVLVMTGLLLVASGCGGRAAGGAPPGKVQNATGYNPASGKVHTPAPAVEFKLK